MKTNKKGMPRLALIVIATALIGGIAAYVSLQSQASTAVNQNDEITSVTSTDPAPAESGFSAVTIDVKAALAPRVLGDEKAPVTIEEYASLSCSHCAHFSKDTFEKLKEKYIDTGKVRLVYNDFPTSGSALEATMAARCLPAERYFQFIKFLFETQNDWAFDKDFHGKLKQSAGLLGLGGDTFEACVSNEYLKIGISEAMQAASKKYEISSTPTFIINGKEKISGAQALSAFEKVIDPLLEAN